MPETKIRDLLKKYWGFDSFRPLQEEIILSSLEGRDTLALLPTGGGKSVCYQVPALAREGIVLVISPLIALMKDQVDGLKKRKISGMAIHSGMTQREIDVALDNAIYGHTKILYLSPERIRSQLFQERVTQMKVTLIAVDEAHCISQWGHDFRPAYLEIKELRHLLPQVPILALTATATNEVKRDILKQLELEEPNIYRKTFKRDNLHLVVFKKESKLNQLLHILNSVPGSALVYVRNRRKCKEIAEHLNENGVQASWYHGGLDAAERAGRQDLWIKNKTRVIVATNAFGMGIDKEDVRVVIHMDLPPSLEEYYQEAGRAGRDGKKAYCVLIYNHSDVKRMEDHFDARFPDESYVRRVYKALASYLDLAVGSGEEETFPFDIREMAIDYDFDLVSLFHALKIIEQSGWILMGEGLYHPSRVMIIVDKDSLYDYQLKHKKLDLLIKAMLRTYEGMFSDFVKIEEGYLARVLNTTTENIVAALEYMDSEGLIEYEPANDQPSITFTLPRSSSSNFTTDKELLLFQKQLASQRMKAVMTYIRTTECRMNEILKYFGEEVKTRCGYCDLCLGSKERKMSKDVYSHLKAEVLKHIDAEPMNLELLLSMFPSNNRLKIIEVLKRLYDESWIDMDHQEVKLSLKKKHH